MLRIGWALASVGVIGCAGESSNPHSLFDATVDSDQGGSDAGGDARPDATSSDVALPPLRGQMVSLNTCSSDNPAARYCP